jgi:8-oxo-dGTP diphosphatase
MELKPTDSPAIAVAVIVREHRVLLIRRRKEEINLSWQFPGGSVEIGESPERAAVRETQEEAGLVVEAVEVLGRRIHPDTGRVVFYVACQTVSGQAHIASKREVAEIAWCDRELLARYVPRGVFPVVQEYLDHSMK